jgi:hypothetical protein
MQVQKCPGTPVTELIADFSSNFTGDLTSWTFGASAGGVGDAAIPTVAFSGGGYVYPAAPSPGALSGDLSQGNLHVTGTVSAASGFGLWFATCSDASEYKGISFKIGGNVGDTKQLTFSIQTNDDAPIDPTNAKGACFYTSGSVNFTPDCQAPSTAITIAEMPVIVQVPFATLGGGKTAAQVNPAELLGTQFAFANPTVPYDVDVKLDDVRFYGGGDAAGAAGAPDLP